MGWRTLGHRRAWRNPGQHGATRATASIRGLGVDHRPQRGRRPLTGLVDGGPGLRDFLARLRRWRVDAHWYAVTLLTPPLLAKATLFALALTSPVFLPGIFASDDKASLLLSGIMAGLVGGLFEEPGWTGFAVPKLRQRYGVFTTGLIVGSCGERGTSLWPSGGAALLPESSPRCSSCPSFSSMERYCQLIGCSWCGSTTVP